jgi:hypothetical protein
MAGSWREILESAAAVERADANGSVHPGEAPHEAESQGGEWSPSVEFHPHAASRRFGEPELTAFLTRLATPPDAGSAALAEEDGPAPPPGRQAPSRARAAGNSLVVAVRAAKAPAEAEKSAPPVYTPSPVSRERRPWRGLLTTLLLAGTIGLSAYALLIPGAKTPDTNLSSQNPSVIEASRVRERPSHSRRLRVLRARHRRAAAARAGALKRCAYAPDLPVCWWRRFPDR